MTNSDLKKNLNTLDVLSVAFGAMIGWGWVVSSGQWITSGGVLGTVIGFLIGGLMIYFVGLAYAELTTAMPKSGGVQNFCYAAFGPVGAFVSTWALILSYVGVVCFEAVSFPTIIQYIYPGFLQGYLYTVKGFDIYATWLIVAVATASLIVYINIKGTKKAAKLQNVLTCIIAGVGLLLVAGSVFKGNSENLSNQTFVGKSSLSIMENIAKVAIMTPFFLFGFDVIPQAAEEINMPLKRLGRMMILSIAMAVGFYAMVVLSIGYVMDSDQMGLSMQGAGLVTADAMAVAFSSGTMAKVLILGGLCGIITSWNSFLIGGSRVMFAMAKSKMIPKSFAKLHPRYKTPVVALSLLGITSIIAPLFGRVMLVWIVDAANFACCLAYCLVAMSFVVLRKKKATMLRPYKVNHGHYVGFMAILMSGIMAAMYLIPGTACTLVWQEWIIVGCWTLLGIFLGLRSKYVNGELFASGM